MANEKPLYTLYKGLKANNYDVPESYDSFERTLTSGGQGGSKHASESRHILYNALKAQNFDVPNTYESFYSTLFEPINTTTSRAKGGYASGGHGAASVHVGQPAAPTRAAASSPALPKPLPSGFGRLSIPSSPMPYVDEARRERAKVQGEGALRSWRQRVKSAQDTKDLEPTQAEQRAIDSARAAKKEEQIQQHPYSGAVGMLHEAQQGDTQAQKALSDAVRPAMQQRKDALDYAQATGGKMLRNPVEIGMTLDYEGNIVGTPIDAPTVARDEKGEMILGDNGKPLVGTTMEPAARNTYKSGIEDAVEAEKRRRAEDINRHLEDAYRTRDELDEQLKNRREELEKKPWWGKAIEDMGKAAHSDLDPMATADDPEHQGFENDEEYMQLMSAARKNHQMIQALEDKRDGKMDNFWHALGTTAMNGYTFADGLPEMRDATAQEYAKKHIKAINEKRQKGLPLTREEQVAEAVLQANYANDAVQSKYGDDYGKWSRAGAMMANSIDYMKDFLLMPGAEGTAKAIAGKIASVAGKVLVKEAGESALKAFPKAIARATLKATGVLVGAHTAGAVISNTTGMGRTAALMAQKASGNVTKDEKGNYKIENEEGLMHALASAEREQMRENGSEMVGGFLGGKAFGGLAKKGLEKIGLSKVSNFLTQMGSKDWYKKYSQFLKTGGYNGIPGEAFEEYEGQLFDALTGHAGDAWNDFTSAKQNTDNWLGPLTIGALMGAIPMGIHISGYYKFRHDMNKADKVAAYRMTKDKWAPLKEELDNTDNGHMADVVAKRVLMNNELSAPEKKAALGYVRGLTKFRAFNIAQVSNAGDEESQKSQGQNDAYRTGYNAVDGAADEHGIKVAYEQARDGVAGMYGEQFADQLDEDPVSTIETLEDGSKGQALASEYLRAKVAYEGMIQRAQDDMEDHVQEVTQQVERRVNTTEQGGDGMIHRATLKAKHADGTEHQVYVVNGTVQMTADGKMVDKTRSSASVVVYDPDTGKMEMVSPESIFTVDEAVDPTEELQVAVDAARNQFAEMRANQIDGILDNGHEVFVPGDDGQPVKGVVTGYDAVEGQYMVETEKPVGGNVVQPFAANQITSALQEGTEKIGGADGQSGETANPESDVPTNDGSNVADGNNAVQETKSTENITAVSPENNNFATAQPTTTVDSEARGAETPAQPEQVNETQQLGQDTQMQESAPTAFAPQTAMSRIPVAKDAQGNAIIDKKTGVPAYRWHEASVEDTAEALAELNEGSLINARDTAQDMEVVTNDRLTKLRKRKAVGGDPISISRSRQQNRLEVEDAEKELAHWRSVKDEINRRMTAATAQRLQAEEAAKSEEQKAAEAEAKRKAQEAYDKREREQIAAAIKTENVKRNKEYPPLVAARKAYADDPEAMEVLSDTEPRDLEETVSSLLKPHSMLWSDTDRGGFAVRGLKSELGLQVGDMRRFMNLIGTVESGAKSVSEVAEDIWANMPEGMQDRYTDHDVKNVILDLFGLDNSSKMLNVAAENRIAQAREVYENNLQREEDAALMAYAEAHHIRPDEVEDFKDWLEQTFPDIIIDEETLARLDEIFAEQLIEQEEYERSHGMGGRPESTGVDRGGQEGQGVVRQQGTAEPGIDTGTAEEGAKQETAEPDAGQAVSGDGVSVQEGARGIEASHTEEPTEPRPIGKDTQSSDTKQGNDEKSLLGIAISDYLDAYARWGGNIDDNSLHDEYKNARDMLLNLLEEESDESLERLVKDSPDDVVKVVMAVRQSRAEAREGIGIHARWLDEHGRIERVSKKNNVGPLSFVAPPAYVSHPILHGVLHDGGMVVGSDGEVLMAERLPYDAGLEGEVTDRRGNIIEGRYPNWRRVLRSVGKPLGADLYDLESWTNGVYALLKRDKVKKAKQDETLVSLRDTEGKVHFYKLGTLSRVVPGARAIGAEGLMVNPENMLFANTEEGSVIAMPRVMPDGYAEGFAYDGGGGIEKQQGAELSVFGGNRGYVGYSMSKRASHAREEGRYPKTDFKKEYGIGDASFGLLLDAGLITGGEWHHTSMFGNRTTFYGWGAPWMAEAYRENKQAIDRLARERGKDNTDRVESLMRESAAYRVYELEQARAKRDRELYARYQQETSKTIPGEYVTSSGAVVLTNGSRDTSRWNVTKDGVALTKRSGKDERNAARQELEAWLRPDMSFEEWLSRQEDETLENDTEARQLATEAVVTALGNAGVDVVMATEEQAAAMIGSDRGDVELHTPDYERRRKREEQNRTIDEATAFVTGKDVKLVRKERMARERERKELAKEIYEKVLQGDFSDVTLRQIDKYISDATPKNPFGRRISERLPQKMERGLHEGERINAIEALFTRICESSVPKNGRFSKTGRRAVERRKEEALKGWAIATGHWHSDLSTLTDGQEPIASGTDSDVYLSKDGKHVIKLSKGKFDAKFPTDPDAVLLFNSVFPNSAYRIVGYAEQNGRFVKILEQPFVDFSGSVPLTVEERESYMLQLGFKAVNAESTVFSNGEIVVADLQKSNIIKGATGKIRVIDADVKLHTPDYGGNYTYLPVDEDLPRAEKQIVYHGSGAKFNAFESSHMGEGEGAQAYGWGHYVTEVEDIGRMYAKKSPQATGLKRSELESNIRRAEERLPFAKGSVKSELERDIVNWKAELENLGDGNPILYAVDIPDDIGSNYLQWEKPLPEEQLSAIEAYLNDNYRKSRVDMFTGGIAKSTATNAKEVDDFTRRGDNVYHLLESILGDDKSVSEMLGLLGYSGISYPAQYQSGSREDGKRNYVIFNDSDLKIVDRVEFMRTGSKKISASETASPENQDHHTVVSSADGAKVLKGLDNLVKEYENFKGNKPNTFIGDAARALGAKRHGSASEYVTFETVNGRVVTIRVANHNAKVSAFDNHGEAEGISIVISPKGNSNLVDDGHAHVMEYYYDAIKLRRADGKPLVEILKSIKQVLYSGEYKDTTGLAEVQEVNADSVSNRQSHGGTVYGWTVGGKIYLTKAGMNPNTPIHEYTHLWAAAMRGRNAAGWESIKNLLKGTPVWDEVVNDENYSDIRSDEDAVASEALSRISGRENAGKMEAEAQKVIDEAKDVFAKAEAVTLLDRMRRALTAFWKWVGTELFDIREFDSIDEVTDRVLYDLVSGTDLKVDGASFNVEKQITRDDVATDEEEDIIARAKADGELSYEHDPVGKMLGSSTRTTRQRREFAERERERMADAVAALSKQLHLDHVEVVTDVRRLEGKVAKAKGFFSKRTGKITIVIPNHASVDDAEKTLLHEAVAHYGLRQLFGKQFDTFLDNVFLHAEPEIRREMVALAAKRGWDFRTATEEYLAGLAEDTNFEKMPATFWMKIKRLFLDMLHGLGFEGWQGPELGDNELRYLLWRSYENLKEPGRYRSILGEAADVAKQYELKVGNYEEAGHRHGMAVNGTEGVNGAKAAEKENVVKPGAWGKRDLLSKAEQVSNGIDADLLFRDSIEDDNNTARATYNAWADASMQIVREAWQDSMINVRNLQKAVLDQRGEKLEDWEDAYNEENRSHGRSRAESEYFGDNLYKPLLDAVNQAAKAAKVSLGDVVEYMMAKHGLERNRVFAERDAKVAWEAYRQKKEEAFAEYQAAHKKGRKVLEDFMEKSYEDFLAQKRERDYSGLTALTGVEDVQEAEAEARGIVEDMEEKAGADSIRVLWDRTNAATKWTLRKAYESGVVSKDNYEHVRDMFAYYIPLRGWDENTAADIYDYVGSGDNGNVFSPTLHTAKGRGSRADNPIAYIGSMAVSAIVEGNKNKVKQSFMRFVENHPTNLVTVSEMWYVNDGTAEAPVWREDVPDIPEDATADDVARIVREHEEDMKQKEEQGLATKKRGGLHLRVPVKKGEALEHHVEVLVNGKKYVLYINGNPRAAQALNGTRARRASARSVESNRIGRLNRWLGQAYTSLSPAFAARNATRDLTMALITTAIKEDPVYALLFRMNVARLGGPVRMFTLMRWYNDYVSEHGLTPPEGVSRTKRYFYEFITQGSETGYTSLKEIDDYKKDMEKLYDNMNRKIYNPMRLMRGLAGGLEYANRCIEDMTRFATYMTSRELGRSIRESTSDAKNITLNFNRKGSGELGNATYRNLQIFVNPSIQSLQNVASIARQHPVKFTLFTGLVGLVGFAMPLATQLLWSVFGGDDDDDGWNAVDEYWKLPSWQRRNNLVIWIPGTRKFAMIALAQEYRVFHGFGETVMSVLSGHDEGTPWLELASQALDLLPLDVMGNGGNPLVNFAPTVVQPALQVSFNSDFTGRPLYKDSEYNKDEPAFQKAYVGTPSWLVSSSELLNDVTGGNAHRQGWLEQVPIVGNVNNPAVVDHLLKGYLGGIYTFLAQLGSVGWTLASGESSTVHDVPVANALVTAPREREQSGKAALPDWYYDMQQENQQWQNERRGFKRDYLSGDSSAKAQWERLEGDSRQQVISRLIREVQSIRTALQYTPEEDEAQRRALEGHLNEVLEQLHAQSAK